MERDREREKLREIYEKYSEAKLNELSGVSPTVTPALGSVSFLSNSLQLTTQLSHKSARHCPPPCPAQMNATTLPLSACIASGINAIEP